MSNDNHLVEKEKISNITSPTIFVILSILTFGLYEFLWMYRTWKFFKKEEKLDIMPFWRVWFAIFFVPSLFEKSLEYAKKVGYKKKYSPGWRAGFWIIFLILFISTDSMIFALAFLITLGPLKAMNHYYAKKEIGCKRRPWKWWHFILISFFTLMWIMAMVGLLLPAEVEFIDDNSIKPGFVKLIELEDADKVSFESDGILTIFTVTSQEDFKLYASGYYPNLKLFDCVWYRVKKSNLICSSNSDLYVLSNEGNDTVNYNLTIGSHIEGYLDHDGTRWEY